MFLEWASGKALCVPLSHFLVPDTIFSISFEIILKFIFMKTKMSLCWSQRVCHMDTVFWPWKMSPVVYLCNQHNAATGTVKGYKWHACPDLSLQKRIFNFVFQYLTLSLCAINGVGRTEAITCLIPVKFLLWSDGWTVVGSVRGGQMHDSVWLDHCWLIWHSPNTGVCGPGTCRRPVMCPGTQPGCVETTDSWNLWISTRAGEDEDLTSSQVFFCKYFLESRTHEVLSVVSPVVMHTSLLIALLHSGPGFPSSSLQMHSS